MASSTLPVRRRNRLVRQLLTAHDLLGAWEDSLRADADTAHAANTDALIALLVETRVSLLRRLDELEEAPPVRAESRAPFAVRLSNDAKSGGRSLKNASRRSARVCVRACRACGRALVRAFREAQRAADSATANVLYGSLRRVEKQLWVLDPLQSR